MLPAIRRARIIELLRRDGAAELKEMSSALSVSVSTLRRDVDYLCEQGHVERTHGGALLTEGRRAGIELEREIASELESDAKRTIGARAAELIAGGQTVILDSGTTTASAARAARDRRVPFTAITNDLAIAALLSESPVVKVHMTGGLVRPGTNTLLGADTLAAFQRLRADLSFVGTHALSEVGMSDSTIELAELKSAIIKASVTPILLADSSKIFSQAFCSFGSFDCLDRLITDARLSEEKRAVLAARGLRLDIVKAG
jgi:DeoR/GlpR family transcriptional regulator of sugar metabolism